MDALVLSAMDRAMDRVICASFMSLLALCLVTLGAGVRAFESPDVLPASQRQALVDKSKTLNPTKPYLSSRWSNRAGTVLTPITLDGVYTADRPFIWNNIDVGGRMTVIEMPTSTTENKPDLWIHSPVGLDDHLKEAMSKLGTVKYIISPNYEHLKYAAEWNQAFPDAETWGCPGLKERKPEISWTGEFPFYLRPVGWKGRDNGAASDNNISWDTDVLQCLHIDMEKNPFTGKPFFSEVIFYHKPSKSLIVTDLFWNYPKDDIANSEFQQDDTWELAPRAEMPLGSRLWKFGMDKVYSPFFNNFMVSDRTAYQDVCNHVLNVWDIENVIPCHGDILRGKGFVRTVLGKFFKVENLN